MNEQAQQVKSNNKKLHLIIGGLVFIILYLLFSSFGTEPDSNNSAQTPAQDAQDQTPTQTAEDQASQPDQNTYLVNEVVDGDTIKVFRSGKTEAVRLIGIDTPETVHPSKPVECYGQEASQKLKDLLLNEQVSLEKDVSETDQFDRLLRFVYLDDEFINLTLVTEGYAHSSAYPPDIKNQDALDKAETQAREANKGLWGNACSCEKGKEVSRSCVACNQTQLTKNNWDCTTYTESVTDDSCKDGCATETPAPTPEPVPQPEPEPTPPTPTYTCNCSKACSNITTCEEAYYQLNTCGCSARDGDDDGVPCESLCN